MAKSAIDALINNSEFRKDNPIILALRRDLAQLSPVRAAYVSGGLMPGQVMARKVSDGLFYKWSAASGVSYDSPCILFDQIRDEEQLTSAASGNLARALFAGYVFKGNCLELDAGAITALGAVAYTDASGANILKF